MHSIFFAHPVMDSRKFEKQRNTLLRHTIASDNSHKNNDNSIIFDQKVPAARVLSKPSGGAAEDNVEERKNSEVTQFFVTCYVRTDGRTDVWTERRGS